MKIKLLTLMVLISCIANAVITGCTGNKEGGNMKTKAEQSLALTGEWDKILRESKAEQQADLLYQLQNR